MHDAIITVENVGKCYQLGSTRRRERYTALRDVVVRSARDLFRRGGGMDADSEFWALRDVSFDVQRGEVLAIIGRNGAGKSTLLKLLSRITEPTEGRITLRGRVASLLEVGTGFHPELTGRENIYLNGAILGMHRHEIKAKFDEIVAFSEVEKFLDTPVKRYSSGMYVRLAFAVAAHMEPEVLVVDEVLAVGDAEFQKKCLGKMGEVARGGRTVLFVSHNMGAVQSLCTTAMALSKGRLVNRGPVRDIVKQYLQGSGTEDEASVWVNSTRQHDGPYFMPRRFAVVDAGTGESVAQIARTDELMVQIEGEIKTLDTALTIGYALFDEAGTMLYWSYQTDLAQDEWPKLPLGPCRLRSRLPTEWLSEGTYRLELIASLYFREWIFQPRVNAPSISVTVGGKMSDSPLYMSGRPGALAPLFRWQNEV